MNLKFLLLIFICVCHQSFAQVVTEVKTAFEIRFDTLLKAKNYEGILIMFKEFESLKIKTQLQNQIFYSCKGLYYSDMSTASLYFLLFFKISYFADRKLGK